LARLNQKLSEAANGIQRSEIPPKNAFLYPDDPNAVIPQYEKQTLVDFRSSNVETAATVYKGSSRPKKDPNSRFVDGGDKEEVKVSDEIEMENGIEEVNDDNGPEELDDDDLADFSNLGLGGVSKKVKKAKKANNMDEENGFIPLRTKKANKNKKNKGGVKKSKKIMRW